MMEGSSIRNFCIIAHIDHGKSTLADRFLEMTHTIDSRNKREQVLDQMDLERERGITIKLAPVTMEYEQDGKKYLLNLIDTPGHVDFSYEVSRSLASVEGAILLVDATQGIQAQTLSTLYLAMEHELHIIPAVNKVDVQNANIDGVIHDVASLLGVNPNEVHRISGKTGEGVQQLLASIPASIPPPTHSKIQGTRALVFDSSYDEYKGVIAFVRVMNGKLKKDDVLKTFRSDVQTDVLELGVLKPAMKAEEELIAGQIGYVVTGLKDVSELKVGDTITVRRDLSPSPLVGYKELQPMVFAGLYAKEGHEYDELREALMRLKLNDASLTYEPNHSPALGFGFMCGFLGMLHLEIVTERLHREYDVNLIVTVPSVAYHVYLSEAGKHAYRRTHKQREQHTAPPYIVMSSALELPDLSHIDHIEEPWMRCDIVTPKQYLGGVMDLVASSRGTFDSTEFLDSERAIVKVRLPLTSILVDFYDRLKSTTAGYASYHYDIDSYRSSDVVRLDIIVSGKQVEALASMVYRTDAVPSARNITEKLKNTIPKQMFEVRIQAAIGATIIASSRIAPLRKDVTAKLYGGDVTRKRKLLEKQKKGKKRMREQGRVDIPKEAYLSVLKR